MHPDYEKRITHYECFCGRRLGFNAAAEPTCPDHPDYIPHPVFATPKSADRELNK